MRIALFAFLAFILSSQCSQIDLASESAEAIPENLLPQQRFYRSGELLANFTITSDSLMHGLYEEYFLDGTVHRRIQYRNGIMDGLYESFYSSGIIASRHYYSKGYTHGPYFWYHENGELAQQGEKVWGKVEGKVEIYYPNGRLQSLSNYWQEHLTGSEFMYYPDGNLQSYAYYDMDADQILTVTYRKDGSVAKVIGQPIADIQADFNRLSSKFSLAFNLADLPASQVQVRLLRRQENKAWLCNLTVDDLHFEFTEPLPDDFEGKYQLQVTYPELQDTLRFVEEIFVSNNEVYYAEPIVGNEF